MSDTIHVVSFSGGKDSTAMLLMMLEKGMPVDDIICCDTGVEFPAMYEHWKKVEEYIKRPITILKEPHGYYYWFLDHEYDSRHKKGDGQIHHMKGYSWARPRARWCTKALKTKMVNQYLKAKYGKDEILQYVGIAYDEPKRHENIPANIIHPLYDWQITEKEALQYCYDKGFDWGGLYEHFHRVSCWCCPLKRIAELKQLYIHYPDLWKQLKDMDNRAYNQFKRNYSVELLEKKFEREIRYEKNLGGETDGDRKNIRGGPGN